MATKVVMFLKFVVVIICTVCYANDRMPCTEEVGEAEMVLAERILRASTPPGFVLTEFNPATQTGRNPHRWICRFERVDNTYRHDCDYLTSVRTAFKRDCPLGCELSQVVVSQSPRRQFISIEYLVNCACTKIRRHRRGTQCANTMKFVREKSTCTGLFSSHY